MSEADLKILVANFTEGRQFGIFGEPRVTFQPRELQNGVLLDPVTVPLARVVFVQADALHLDIQALLDGPDPRRV